jgi:hypothetical protein
MKLSQKFTSLTNMKTSTDRQRTLEMACISQLAYVAYKQGNDIARDILKTRNIEGLIESGLPIPQPTSIAQEVEVLI